MHGTRFEPFKLCRLDRRFAGGAPHIRRFRRFMNLPVAFLTRKLSEKRMHFVREKRDKPPGWRFHAGKRLSEKRDSERRPAESAFTPADASSLLPMRFKGSEYFQASLNLSRFI